MKPILAAFLLLTGGAWAAFAEPVEPSVDARVEGRLRAGEVRVPVLIRLRDTAEVSPGRRALADVASERVRVTRRYSSAALVAGVLDRAGLEELRQRADVAAISLDGVVRPADEVVAVARTSQIGSSQMRADLVSTGGLDGFGRSVAVVDSGIDPTHPDLGGGTGTNLKVHAGWNIADDNADITDCSGHGTAVAGVIASPQGVAPGAGLVPLRVFSGRTGCQTASFSDVLAAVDWAITHRHEQRIDVLNLSLADDRIRPGFCDAEDPATAAVLEAARDAGIAVVAAAGNGGRKDGLSWPACFSSVISVGMVYSTSAGPVSWGEAGCRDTESRPDAVPCASNSGAALSLLAPGVRWSTDAPGGGRRTDFSGTSAASPAAAAALLLLRQTRPFPDPLLAAELLRATGSPVVDAPSGVAAPRVDLAAALQSPAPVTGPCTATAVGLECVADVGSVVGDVASVLAALSLDHPEPSRLTIVLTAPDGTAVLLDRGRESRAGLLREVYGRTVSPAEPLGRFAGRPAAGRWRLSVTDPLGRARVVSWGLLVTVEPPRTPRDLSAPTAWLPAAAHQAGSWGAFFTTDLRVVNADRTSPRDVTLGAAGRVLRFTVPAGGTRALDDVLLNAFRVAGVSPIWVSAGEGVSVQARTVSSGPLGEGAPIASPTLAPAGALAQGSRTLLLPLGDRRTRLNVGALEIEGAEARFEVTVKSSGGGMKGTASAAAAPHAMTQINDVYREIGAEPEEGDVVELLVTKGTGRLLPFATRLDNESNSGRTVVAAEPLTTATIPVPHGHGTIDLLLGNAGPRPLRVSVDYSPASGLAFAAVVVPVAPGETRLLPDVLAHFARIPNGGTLRITDLDAGAIGASQADPAGLIAAASTRDGGSLPVVSRATAMASPGGEAGSPSVSGLAAAGAGLLQILPFVTASTRLGVVETGGRAARARLLLLASDGELLASEEIALSGRQTREIAAFAELAGATPSGEATAVLEVLEGSAAAWAMTPAGVLAGSLVSPR